jgi:adenine deaminase
MGLVDGDECGLALGEHLGEAGDAEAFGSDEEELEFAGEIVAACLTGVVAREAGVDASYFEAKGGEFAGLIVHERYEWADDECGASAGDGGELVAEAFARSSGHDEEDVVAFGSGAADCLLVGPKASEAEGFMKKAGEVHEPVYLRILFALEF